MSLLTDAQLASIRRLGEKAMTKSVTIRRVAAYAHDDTNPFGDDDLEVAPSYEDTVVLAWVISVMGRDFSEDGDRIVAIHDFTIRVPVGTSIDARDIVLIDGLEYIVTEANVEDTWAEWTEAYLKRIS